jgi:small GTP-binding protein
MSEPPLEYDVFISHSRVDKMIVHAIAARLRDDGLKVWLDEWVIKPGDSVPAKIDHGLEHSRVLVLFMSANAFGSDWARLESYTFRFRDPLNTDRRFVPVRLDDTDIKGSIRQFLYIDWRRANDRDREYTNLREACRSSSMLPGARADTPNTRIAQEAFWLKGGRKDQHFYKYLFDYSRRTALALTDEHIFALWNFDTGECLRVFLGHRRRICGIAWSADYKRVLSASEDGTARLWDVESGDCLRILRVNRGSVLDVSWSADQRQALTTGDCGEPRVGVWNLEEGRCVRAMETGWGWIRSPKWSKDQRRALTTGQDQSIRLWDLETARCMRVLKGHTDECYGVLWSADERRVISCSGDNTVRIWDLEKELCVRVLEGHTHRVTELAWIGSERFVVSGSRDTTLRLWEVESGRCLGALTGHESAIRGISWSAAQRRVISGDETGGIRTWDLSDFVAEARARGSTPEQSRAPDQVQYTNAKVLLVGDTGAGKTGLAVRLAFNKWALTDSTVGAWATQWKLPVDPGQGIEREIWLWDFGGQADQRLIHQLYMDETTMVVLVFDGQKEDLFDSLDQWDRDLSRASRKAFVKLLVAGRVDAGGLRVSRTAVEKFATASNFSGFLETSAKMNTGCDELRKAILAGIKWDELPCRTTEVLFRRLKEEIIRLRDEGRVLLRFNELRETLQLRLSGRFKQFTDEQLRAVLTLLTGPGVVWELAFGNWVLLQPERINAYAQSVIRTLQADKFQRGCLMEEHVLKGELVYESSMERLEGDDERFVLLAMHQTLVERGLCLRQPTGKGNLLIFPSYYRRERQPLVETPAVLVSYRFTGFLDELYATLVVRLHHTDAFAHGQLWRYAADFDTNTGKQLGVKLTRRAPGLGELEVYFDPAIAMEEKIIFSKYVHEHLLQYARDVERSRHYVCSKCGTPVGNRDAAMKRLSVWLSGQPHHTTSGAKRKGRTTKQKLPSIICVECEHRVLLWDEMEQCFASPEIQRRVRDMQEEASVELSTQSKERALVGEVISTVALANQICREFNVSDQGIDMEIEFNTDFREPAGAKLYLQLKSENSYFRERNRNGDEVFRVKDEQLARYWMEKAFPVLLVIRTSAGEVQWMEIRDYLRRTTENGRKPVERIVFKGERLDVMSVRRWRERALGQ